MALHPDYRPRFSFDITNEQQKRCQKLFVTHGQRKVLMNIILDDLLDMLEEHGQVVAGIILNRMVAPREVVPIMKSALPKKTRAKKGV